MVTSDSFILYYHELDTPNSPTQSVGAEMKSLVVDAAQFALHLDSIVESGRQVVSLDDVIAQSNPTCDQVVITFDDGYRSDFELALPRLLERGMTATSYVIAGKIGVDSNYMTFSQLRQMQDAGMTIGSHTLTHPWLPLVSRQQLRSELVDSKHLLEDELGTPIDHFCLPGGHYTRAILDDAMAAGYRTIASCEIGPVSAGTAECLPRFEVRRDLNADQLLDTFQVETWRKLQVLEARKARLRRLLGLRAYTALRSLAYRFVTINR